tara:strand:- start:287 stop:826 length:540 start_codon:yes stop_codon:yes gene_type:complete
MNLFKSTRLKIYLILILLLFNTGNTKENNQYVFIDLDYIVQNSNAGKSVNASIKKRNDKIIKELLSIEKKLKADESKIISQKNLISKEEFNKQISKLKEDIKAYKNLKQKKTKELTLLKIEANKKAIEFLNPILSEYSKEQSISLILQKRNIVMGKNELDITQNILKIFNQKVKKIEIN